MNMEDNAYNFSVRLAEIVRYLRENSREFSLNDKLLDCGVRAGISVREGNQKAAADYVEQADYILEMAVKSGYLTEHQSLPIRTECTKLLTELRNAEKTVPSPNIE